MSYAKIDKLFFIITLFVFIFIAQACGTLERIFVGDTLEDKVISGCTNEQYTAIFTELNLCGESTDTLSTRVTAACNTVYAPILRELEICQ